MASTSVLYPIIASGAMSIQLSWSFLIWAILLYFDFQFWVDEHIVDGHELVTPSLEPRKSIPQRFYGLLAVGRIMA